METNTNNGVKLSSAADQHKNCSVSMMSGQTAACESTLAPLLLGKQGRNITFVLESSETTRAVLGSVKRLLIQTLLTKASLRDSLFNVITFSSKVSCWSRHMLSCAPDTVYTSLSWIHSISCSSGRDLLAALSVALTDPACHSVHLLCADLPEQPEAVLRALPALAAGRPLTVFYLQDSGAQLDRNTRDFLQCLTQTTSGNCYLIPFDLNGVLEKVIPLYVAESQSSLPSVSPAKCRCPSTSVITPQLHDASSCFTLGCSLGNPLLLVPSCVLSEQTLNSRKFFPGCRVLARKEGDGLYYLGTVIQQVQDCRGIWLVEFDHPESARFGIFSSQRQLVCSLDMVNDSRASTRSLAPGDAVLSPWEPDMRRYGPGRVVAATERRDGFVAGEGVRSLRVLMWNSCVSLIPESLVLPISTSHHDGIVRELRIPKAGHYQCCSWLRARSPSYTECCQSACTSCCCSPCLVPHSLRASFGRAEGFDRAEQDKQVNLRDANTTRSNPEAPSSSSSSSLSEDGTRAPTSPFVKIRSKQQRPPWRYWSRTGPEPQHRQPGSTVPRRTSRSVTFSFPVPQISASPNHSSLFQSLPGTRGRTANMREVLSTSNFKPRPPSETAVFL